MAENIIKDVKLKIGTENQFQSKLKDLPLNTLVGTTDPIQEGELDTSIITKLNKAENALPKPTNDSTGSAGQVLKKTANGSEWGDAPSGGGKLYKHIITVNGNKTSSSAPYTAGWTIIDNHSAPYTFNELIQNYYYYNGAGVGMPILVYSPDPQTPRFLALLTDQYKIVVGMTEESDFGTATNFKDTVTEL